MAYSSRYQVKSLPHLRTGMNNRFDPTEIMDTDMADCENVEVDTRSIKSAAGYVNYGGATGPFFGGFHAKFEDGTNRLIRQRGTILEYDNGGGTWTECTLYSTGSPAATKVLTEIACDFAMLNDTVIWSNGTDSVMSSTDGITWTEQATLPKAKKLFNNGLNRILYMVQPAAPSKISWSDINDPVTVGASSFQFIGKNDGAEVMDAVLMPNGSMLLLKTDRFYQISDITLNTTAVDPIGKAPCVMFSAVATENSAMWSGPDGRIYEFDGQKANVISDNIAPLNITKSASMRAVYHNYTYRLAVPTSTDAYNSYEYVVNRKVQTGNPNNPYTITKNQRYIGCYIQEDREVSGVRRTRLYFGDGRPDAVGSPAAVPTTFAYINDTHNTGVTQGLDGAAQTCTFTTKFFTEETPFFLKRFTKYFVQAKSDSDFTLTLAYRFDQFTSWTETSISIAAASVDWEYDDGTTGGFSEGYSFSASAMDNEFKALEKEGEERRGIQFKLTWSTTNDVDILSQGFKFLTSRNFY